MQLFFNKTTRATRIIHRNPGWSYARSGLLRNLTTTVNYYQSRGFAVKGNHLLIRLLNSIGVSHDMSLERYYEIVSAKTSKIGMHFKMTSSTYSGQLFDGVFYGPGTKEIIFADDTYISPFEIKKNWKSIQAVKVLDHPRSDLELILPNGKLNSTETGLASISVNIPALATQFRQFAIEEHKRANENGDSPSTMAFFIYRYVLPNMLYSHQDVALFNRAYNYSVGKPMGETLNKNVFTLLDYTKYVDPIYKELTAYLTNTEVDFRSILKSYPLVSVDSFAELMVLPENAPTRQIAWAEFLTRLKCIHWLVSLGKTGGRAQSGVDVNYLLRAIHRYSSDGVFKQIADQEIYNETIRVVKDITQLCDKANYHVR